MCVCARLYNNLDFVRVRVLGFVGSRSRSLQKVFAFNTNCQILRVNFGTALTNIAMVDLFYELLESVKS